MKNLFAIIFFILPTVLFSQSWQMISPSVTDFKSLPLTKPLIAFWGGNRSTDGGKTWKKIFLDSTHTPSNILAFTLYPPYTIYLLASGGNIFRSTDLGVSFIQTTFPSMEQLVVSRNGDTLYGVNHNISVMGLYDVTNRFSIDSGKTWTSYTDALYTKKPSDKLDFAFDTPMYFDTRILRINSVNRADVYFHLLRHMVLDTYNSWEIEKFYKSTAAGKEGSFYSTIEKRTYNIGSYSRGKEIEVSSFTGDTLILETESEIYISTDRGEKWNSIYIDSKKQLQTITVDWTKDIIYLGSSDKAKYPGVWSSSDFGNTWTSMNQGFLNTLDIKVLRLDWEGNLYATKGDGLYIWKSVTEVKNKDKLINDFILSQNYPNPFSTSTTIKIDLISGVFDPTLSYEERVKSFKIFDLLGREALDLSDEANHKSEIVIRNSQLPHTGIYFYRLTIGDKSQTKMMTRIKTE